MTTPLAVIFGCASTSLDAREKAFFRDAAPLGFILFARNIQNPDQVRSLIEELRQCCGRDDTPILIDQEGGRVQRLSPPHWRDSPPPGIFANLHDKDQSAGLEAVRLNARLIAATLSDLTITVNCLPCLDIPQSNSHEFLRGRMSGNTAEQSTLLGQATCDGLLSGGIMPVIKHIPGHGRATTDSHLALPRITASREDLQGVDFVPFKALRLAGWAMTAHVIYDQIDADRPASTSPIITQQIIREHIGFDGFLVSDDICMQALSGSITERFSECLRAGSDTVLHCNGNMDEMKKIADTAHQMNDRALERYKRGQNMVHAPQPFDRTAGLARLEELLQNVGGSS